MTEKKNTPKELAEARLDRCVRELFELTWARARDMIDRGKISVGGSVTTDHGHPVREGEEIAFDLTASAKREPTDVTDESVVHMDKHLIVVEKPAGLLTVPFEQGDKGTLDQKVRSFLAARSKGTKKRRSALPPLMVVHRLDKGTSGLLVFARTFQAKEGLAQQFRAHDVERVYTAIVHGEVKARTITSHLLLDRGDGIRGSRERARNPKVRRSGKGRKAVTHVKPVKKLLGATLIECTLETGRTNQIRIHLAEEGHPILGETTYMRDFKQPRIEAPRLMLHAGTLGFTHPLTGEPLRFESAMPGDMRELIGSRRLGLSNQ